MKSKIIATLLALSALMFTSCLAIAMDSNKNSKGSGKIPLMQKADLLVSNIEYRLLDRSPAGQSGKQLIQFSVTVKNQATGPRAASTANSLTKGGMAMLSRGKSKLRFCIDDSSHCSSVESCRHLREVARAIIRPLAPGASQTVRFNLLVSKAVPLTYVAIVDSFNWIDEWNETNNLRRMMLPLNLFNYNWEHL